MIEEPKPLPENYYSLIKLKDKRGHKERELGVVGKQGTQYRIILRQSDSNKLDFSIVLAVNPTETNQLFRLRRYNGKSHEHTNQIEAETLYDFHIHYATERYQDSGLREDAFAKVTDRFADFNSALSCMIEDCGFEIPKDPQGHLFGE
jgi:hypothetical protein